MLPGGSYSAVPDPSSHYWQSKIADLVESLTTGDNDEIGQGGASSGGVRGVYLDQIGAEPAYTCYDTNHAGHQAGGGDYWTSGFNQLMDRAHEQAGSSTATIFVTEGQAEPYMGHVQGHLVINGFSVPPSPLTSPSGLLFKMVSVFQCVMRILYMYDSYDVHASQLEQ